MLVMGPEWPGKLATLVRSCMGAGRGGGQKVTTGQEREERSSPNPPSETSCLSGKDSNRKSRGGPAQGPRLPSRHTQPSLLSGPQAGRQTHEHHGLWLRQVEAVGPTFRSQILI